ncbi:MAG: hypothetical protein PHE51_09470, partial [Eubacteriales bacterium]|nr:hypothetical protein [Eubacteriales bacterium]
MKTVLYLNNNKIQIISLTYKQKKPTVQNKIKLDLPPGTIVNGVIINNDAIVQALTPHKKLLRNATAIINSSNIYTKKLDFPKLTKKQMLSIIKSEFSIPDDTNILYDSSSYCGPKNCTVICCAAPAGLISNYVRIFKEMRISVKKIDIVQNAVAKFVKSQEQLKDKTFVLNIVEGSHLVSMLFEKGEYLHTNRSSILPENDDSSYAEPLVSNLSTMIQFSKSEKSENAIEASYYVGLDNKSLEGIKELSEQRLGSIEIRDICDISDIVPSMNDFFYPLIATISKNNDINLLARFRAEETSVKVEKHKTLTRTISALSLAIIVSVCGYLYFRMNTYLLTVEKTRITDYLTSPSAKQTLDEISYKSIKDKKNRETITEV